MPLAEYTIIRAYLPKEGHAKKNLLTEIVDLLKESAPVGCMGNYAAVYACSESTGGFTPLAGANPTKGIVDLDEACSDTIFTTYAAAHVPPEAVERFVDKLVHIHPFEHPLIEIYREGKVYLWTPN